MKKQITSYLFFIILLIFKEISFPSLLYEFKADSGLVPSDSTETWFPKFRKCTILNNSWSLHCNLDGSDGGLQTWQKTFNLLQSISFRFNFCFDTIIVGKKKPWAPAGDRISLALFTFINDDRIVHAFTETFVSHFLIKKNGKWHLRYSIFFPDRQETWKMHTACAIKAGTPYCLEFLARLGKDSVVQDIEFRVNGDSTWTVDVTPIQFKLKRCILLVGSMDSKHWLKGNFFFDDLGFGTRFLGSPPKKPVITKEILKKLKAGPEHIFLYSPSYQPFLTGSSHSATRYQFHVQNAEWGIPLFDSGMDSLSKDSIDVNLMLDPDRDYFWRIKHYSQNGNQSDWSEPAVLPYRRLASPSWKKIHPRIHVAFFTQHGHKKPTKRLEKERWYDILIKLSLPEGFMKFGYAVFWTNNAYYTLGNPRDKGGKFFPEGSYTYNLSNPHPSDPPKVFERNLRGTFKAQRLYTEKGLYLDPSKNGFQINPADSTVRCRLRFLKEALPGKWSLRGVVRNEKNLSSPLFYGTFTLVDPAPAHALPVRSKRPFILLSILILITLLTLLFMMVKKPFQKPGPRRMSKEDELFEQFKQYVADNIRRDISISEIESHLSMSHSAIFKIVKRITGKNIKNYIISVKMEKAKELLTATNKNVTEVMYEIGFNNPAHFTKTFKKYTGKLPSHYRG